MFRNSSSPLTKQNVYSSELLKETGGVDIETSAFREQTPAFREHEGPNDLAAV